MFSDHSAIKIEIIKKITKIFPFVQNETCTSILSTGQRRNFNRNWKVRAEINKIINNDSVGTTKLKIAFQKYYLNQ